MGPVVATSQRGQAARRQRALTPESGGGPWNRQLARTHRSSERIAMKGTSGGLRMRPLPTIDLSKAGIDELVRRARVGGDLGGPVSPETSFPQSLLVDYVRVYSP
jgi:hypothetical protein